MTDNMSSDFPALDHKEFMELYLLNEYVPIKPRGELARRTYEANKENTRYANQWATEIFNDIRRDLKQMLRRQSKIGVDIDDYEDFNHRSRKMKKFRFGRYDIKLNIFKIVDFVSQKYPAIDIEISPRKKISIDVYDSNNIAISISPQLHKGLKAKSPHLEVENRRKFNSIDQSVRYIKDILRHILWA